MTLLINATTPQNVIQASDRRLTLLPDGSLYNDEANKVICVSCKDEHFAIAYTGLAEIEKQRTDIWIVDYLTAINAHKMTVELISESIEKYATSCLKTVDRRYRRTSLVLAGYRL